MKATVNINRPDCGDGKLEIVIEVRGSKPADRLRVKLTPKNFAMAITGRSEIPAIIDTRGVFKRLEQKQENVAVIKARVSEIEDAIANQEMDASQVFTQMRQLIKE